MKSLPHPTRALASPITVVLAFFLTSSAAAQTLSEARALLRADRVADAMALADKRLAAEPMHLEALVAKVEATLQGKTDNRLDAAVALAERCVAQHPNAARCHTALGDATASKALSAGMLSAMRLAGRIRDAYQKAVSLDGQLPEARFNLLQYYLQAPAIVGGGVDKARELADESAKALPQEGPLFLALVAMAEKKVAEAERLALGMKAAADSDAAERQTGVLQAVGFAHMQAKRPADAQRVFALLLSRDPKNDVAAFGLGRTAQEQGQHAAAIGHFERAIALKAAAHHHFRMAQCHQAAGDKAAALAAYERALAFKPPLSDKQRGEATEQLAALKG
jgi:tetratricopeptide (TPR) repeat protein